MANHSNPSESFRDVWTEQESRASRGLTVFESTPKHSSHSDEFVPYVTPARAAYVAGVMRGETENTEVVL